MEVFVNMNQHINATSSATNLYYPRAWAYTQESKATPTLPQQLADLCAAARLEGYCLVGQSYDLARCYTICRPGRRALLCAVRNGQVDDVFVTRLSQLSRKRGRLRHILALFQRKGVRVHTTEIDLRCDLYRHNLENVLAGGACTHV